MKNKKIVSLLLAITLVASVLAGCGAKKEEGKTVDGKASIRFATWDNAEDLDYQQELVDKFNSSQDKITVSLEAYGAEYDTKISAGMGAGDTPDVVYMWNYPTYYEALEPLGAYMEQEGEGYQDNFYETLWDYNTMNEQVYGIPVGFTTHALYYNKDIFAQANIPEPTDDWTWDDLKAAAKTISETVEGVTPFTFPMKPDPYDYEMYLWSNDTSIVDKEGVLEGNLNSEKSQQTIQFFQDMEKEGIALATEKNGTDEFRGSKSAMYIYGAWSISSFNKDGLNYGVVNIPAFAGASGDSVSILSSSGLSISKDSKNKEAAWEFIKYWTGDECNKARIGYELPAVKSVVESEGIMQDEKTSPFYVMLEQSEGHTPASFIVEDWSTLYDTLTLSFERIFNPSALEDVKTVLDEAAAQ